jgi:hypothetical protein
MSGPVLDVPLDLAIDVPPEWFEIDLVPETRDRSITDLIAERTGQNPPLREHRADLLRLLKQEARRAWDGGVVWCACLAEPIDDSVLLASATLSLIEGPVCAPVTGPEGFQGILAPLSDKTASYPGDTWRRVTAIKLPLAGEGGRLEGVEDLYGSTPDKVIRSVVMQTFVPIPHANRVAIVTCTSPSIALAEPLLELFDAITSTARIERLAEASGSA